MPNLAALIASSFAKYGKDIGVKSCTLTKSTPGTRGVDPSAGTSPTETDYQATGFVADYASSLIDGTLIQRGDREIAIFGASLPAGVVPDASDKITIADPSGVVRTYRVVPKGVTTDSVGAVYLCQARA